MQVIVDSLATNYTRAGRGTPVLLLHGWADPIANWQAFVGLLAKKHEVVAVDLPGFGGTQAPDKAWGLDEYAAFVAAFIKKITYRPATVIGHSNGGAIAIRGLASGAFAADKLVLLASAGIRGEYNGRNKLLRAMTKTGKALSAPLPTATKQKLRRKVYQSVGSDMLVAEYLQDTFRQIVVDDVRADAAKVQIPTLLIYGEKDEQTPVRYGELYHQLIDGSTLEILTDADHFLYRTHAPRVVQLIEDFI